MPGIVEVVERYVRSCPCLSVREISRASHELISISLRRKTSVVQQDSHRMVAKLISYVIQLWKLQFKHNYSPSDIIAMDKTLIWCDMISETTFDATGMRSATIKTTRHEKTRVLVMFAANADGTKLKPMVVF